MSFPNLFGVFSGAYKPSKAMVDGKQGAGPRRHVRKEETRAVSTGEVTFASSFFSSSSSQNKPCDGPQCETLFRVVSRPDAVRFGRWVVVLERSGPHEWIEHVVKFRDLDSRLDSRQQLTPQALSSSATIVPSWTPSHSPPRSSPSRPSTSPSIAPATRVEFGYFLDTFGYFVRNRFFPPRFREDARVSLEVCEGFLERKREREK